MSSSSLPRCSAPRQVFGGSLQSRTSPPGGGVQPRRMHWGRTVVRTRVNVRSAAEQHPHHPAGLSARHAQRGSAPSSARAPVSAPRSSKRAAADAASPDAARCSGGIAPGVVLWICTVSPPTGSDCRAFVIDADRCLKGGVV